MFYKKKLFYYLKYIFFLICICFLFYKIYIDFDELHKFINLSVKNFLIIGMITIIGSNIVNYRFYFILKKITKYSDNYISWSLLFFQTATMNILFFGSGHIVRALKLKKKKLSYSNFISVNLIVYLLILFVNFFFFISLFYYFYRSNIILLGLIASVLILYILINIQVYDFFHRFFNKNFFFSKKFKKLIINIFLNLKKSLNKKNYLLNFFLFTLIIFLLESFGIFVIYSSFFEDDLHTFFLILFLIFYLNKILFLNNFFGLIEIITGLVAEISGLLFLQGVLVQLMYRLALYISMIINNLIYYLISVMKKKSNKRNIFYKIFSKLKI